QRKSDGAATAIIGPFGQVTGLDIEENGFLSKIVDPAGNAAVMSYDAGGLMGSFTDQLGDTPAYEYDAVGRLQKITDERGASTTLERTNAVKGWTVVKSTPLGRATSYSIERGLLQGEEQLTNTFADGTRTRRDVRADGSRSTVLRDGTSVEEA